jgi:hypothetical protein
MTRSRRRPAPTWVGAAAVVAIAVVLLATLIPALQRARDTDTRNRCEQNLKQIMLAAHNYQSAFNQLPPGYLGPLPIDNTPGSSWKCQSDGQQVGVLPFLLPYLSSDLERVYKQLEDPAAVAAGEGPSTDTLFDIRSRGYGDKTTVRGPLKTSPDPNNPGGASQWWLSGTNYALAGSTLKNFVCPASWADPEQVRTGTTVSVLFQINGNDTAQVYYFPAPFDRGHGYPSPGLTSYAGVCGARGNNIRYPDTSSWTANFPQKQTAGGWAQLVGVLDNRTSVSLTQLPDGTAWTAAFGEGTGEMANGVTTLGWSWMGHGAAGMWQGLGGPDGAPWAAFGSRHTAVVQFAFADGSVHSLNRDVNRNAWLSARPNPPAPRSFLAWWELARLCAYQDGFPGGGPLDGS